MCRRWIVVIIALAGCDSASKTEEFCSRADSCNVLSGSVEECIEDLDVLLDDLPSSDREEVLYEVQKCLDRPSCSGFASCVQDL
jgi:hypothetical protein